MYTVRKLGPVKSRSTSRTEIVTCRWVGPVAAAHRKRLIVPVQSQTNELFDNRRFGRTRFHIRREDLRPRGTFRYHKRFFKDARTVRRTPFRVKNDRFRYVAGVRIKIFLSAVLPARRLITQHARSRKKKYKRRAIKKRKQMSREGGRALRQWRKNTPAPLLRTSGPICYSVRSRG